jgi:hypothetical protein
MGAAPLEGIAMRVLLRATVCAAFLTAVCQAADQTRVVLVVGAGGTGEYEKQFAEWRERIIKACRTAEAELISIGGKTAGEEEDKLQLQRALAETGEANQVWLILLGHGTFDGKTARFNLRGPDVSANELAEWLTKVPCPVAIVNCSSASGSFLEHLAGEGRIVVTATKSGFEHNYSRFGDYFSQSLNNLEADLDKDDQVSLLEAFLFASRRVEEYYADANRLTTEHALLDDNGDGQGTAADLFQGVRMVKQSQDSKQTPDGSLAHRYHLVLSPTERGLTPEVLTRRDELERELTELGQRKAAMATDEYYQAVEVIALELARIYQAY